MQVFMIEAYGGVATTNGAIHHFAVQAETADEAIGLVRHSAQGLRYGRFEVIEIGNEIDADEAGIIAEGDDIYPRTL